MVESVWCRPALTGLVLGLLLTACQGGRSTDAVIAERTSQPDPSQWVNLFVGSQSGAQDFGTGGGGGNTFPGATLPFGMLQFSPNTVPSTDNFSGGYTYSDTAMDGFSLTHISGAGCAIYQDVPFMPTAQKVTQSPARLLTAGSNARYHATFDHAHEQAQPGYYQVLLDPQGAHPINVELTAGRRSGMARFDFTQQDVGRVLINPGGSEMANGLAQIAIDADNNEVSGASSSGRLCYQDNSYTVYFVAQFDTPIVEHGVWKKLAVKPGQTQAQDRFPLPINAQPVPGGPAQLPGDPSTTAQAGGWVGFNTQQQSRVQMKVGISFVSIDNARANLRAENPGWDFDGLHAQAADQWREALSKIELEQAGQAHKRIFYTALYHSLLAPNTFSDANGDYLGMDGQRYNSGNRVQYSSFSGWDTYRTQMPLLAMLMPQRAGDMLQSLLNNYQHSGWLPKWSYANQHTNVMVGDPAALLISTSQALGVTNFDQHVALQAMLKGATQPAPLGRYLSPGNSGYIQRPGLPLFRSLGYIPFELNVPSGAFGLVHKGLVWGTVSTGLEYALADFAIARFAQRIGQQDQADAADLKPDAWRDSFNPATGYIQPRLSAGLYLPAFDPASGLGYTEGSGAQYSWFVPHQMDALVEAIGGVDAALARLDDFFTELNAGPESAQAFLGNEPSFYTPWVYAWLDRPGQVTPVVWQALTELFADEPGGMPGNDDLGAMSSWWVLASLGLMPAVPGTDTLLLNAPLMSSATLHRPTGPLHIRRRGDGTQIQALKLNDQPLEQAWLPYMALPAGSTLSYEMGEQASDWAQSSSARPPSWE